MISPPEIIEFQRVDVAIIPIICRREEMMAVFGPAVQELFAALDAQGIDTIGPVFAHHLTMPPGMFNFELGVVTLATAQPAGRVRPGTLGPGRIARTIYTGPYEGLHTAWGTFDAWVRAQGRTPGEDLWELYVHGPDKTPNPAEWRTELNRPLLA